MLIPNELDMRQGQLVIIYGEEEGFFYVLDPSTTLPGGYFLWRAVCFNPSHPWPELNDSLLHVILYHCEASHALILWDAC